MKNFNNELVVHRNETFTIDKIVQNKDGSPYVLSNQLQNPYFLLSVASSKYQQKDRYLKNWWLPVDSLPRFNSTQTINLRNLKNENDESIHDFDDVTTAGSIPGETNKYYIAYEPVSGGNAIYYEASDAVYYIKHGDNITYKYAVVDEQQNVTWYDYELRIVKSFLQEDTRDWVEQSYVYSIQLVSGQSVTDYLRQLCDNNDIEYELTDDKYTLYELLSQHNVITNIDIERPLVSFDVCVPILAPTKLTVLSDLQGGM